MKKITFLLLFISHFGFAQSGAITEVMEEMVWEQDSLLSVYNWVTENISQNVKRSKKSRNGAKPKKRKGKASKKATKPKTPEQIADLKLKRIINRKKGTSLETATLFDAMVSSLGYSSHIIYGYTKNLEGEISDQEQAWNAVNVKGQWKLYDASRGAGVINNRKFVKKYDPTWSDASPQEMIKGHMPYDPIWQLLETPVRYDDFDKVGEVKSSEGAIMDAQKVSEVFKLTGKQKLEAMLERSLANGTGNELVTEFQEILKDDIYFFDTDQNEKILEDTKKSYSDIVSQFEEYKKAKKNKFKDKKWKRKNARKALEAMYTQLDDALNVYDTMEIEDDELIKSVNKEIDFCDKYLDKVDKEREYMESLTPLKMELRN